MNNIRYTGYARGFENTVNNCCNRNLSGGGYMDLSRDLKLILWCFENVLQSVSTHTHTRVKLSVVRIYTVIVIIAIIVIVTVVRCLYARHFGAIIELCETTVGFRNPRKSIVLMTPKRNNNSYNNKSYKDGSADDIRGVSRWVVTILITVVRVQLYVMSSRFMRNDCHPRVDNN